jgi:positive regulator of sigma E activity
MEEKGKVVAVVGDFARVEIARGSGCASCKACARGSDGRTMFADIHNRLHAKVGDLVLLTIPDSTITNLALLTYGLPTLGFLLGFFLFRHLSFVVRLCGTADLASVLGAAILTAASFVVIRVVSFRRRHPQGNAGSVSAAPVEFLEMAGILPAQDESQKACISDNEQV